MHTVVRKMMGSNNILLSFKRDGLLEIELCMYMYVHISLEMRYKVFIEIFSFILFRDKSEALIIRK